MCAETPECPRADLARDRGSQTRQFGRQTLYLFLLHLSSISILFEQTDEQSNRAACLPRTVYNGSCLRNASVITIIGLISELAARKCHSG